MKCASRDDAMIYLLYLQQIELGTKHVVCRFTVSHDFDTLTFSNKYKFTLIYILLCL